MVYGDSFTWRYRSWLLSFQVKCVSLGLKCRCDECYWYFGLKIPKLFDGFTEENVGEMKYFIYLVQIQMRFTDEKTRKSGFYTFVYRNNVKWGLGKFCFYIAQSFNNADVWSICLIIVWFLQFLAYIYINTSFFNRLQVGKYYSFPCQKWIWRGSSWVVGFESAWKKTKNVSGESWTLHIQW